MLARSARRADEIRFAHLSPRVRERRTCASATTECHLSWVDLPGIARYRRSSASTRRTQRLTLELPSPFLRSMPTRLIIEGGEIGSAHSWAARGDRLLRGGVQARARRVLGLHPHRARAADLGRGRPARHAGRRGGGAHARRRRGGAGRRDGRARIEAGDVVSTHQEPPAVPVAEDERSRPPACGSRTRRSATARSRSPSGSTRTSPTR